MLPYNKFWLQNEMHEIEAQTKKDKLKKRDTRIMFQWLCCLLLFFVSVASAQDVFFICPCCRCVIEAEIKDHDFDNYNMKVKEGTWICPKKTCRYKNDNRIRYCGMCGTERQ